MYRLTEHLIKLGHRDIAFVSAPLDLLFASHRLEGYRQALEAHVIPYTESLVAEGQLTERSGYSVGRELLTRDGHPTAIVACNDLMALGVMSAARELGLTIGQDVAVAGFDDVSLAEHAHPSLTTVRQPVYEIGWRICEMLITLLQGKPLADDQVILQPQLIVRESCGSMEH
jgi:DNA-binding LacI/PurR family transcriptional regulator